MAPGMGVSYADLARLRKPEIPGQGLRPGLSAGAAIGYGQDQRAFEGMINQAMPLAEQDAQMKMQAGQEWTQGAAARGLSREAGMLKDQQSITEMQDPSAIAAKIAEKVAKLSEAKRKDLESRAHIFAGLSRAKSLEDFNDLLDYYGDEAVINGKSLRGMPPERAKALATGITEGLKMTPKYQQAMDVQNRKNEGFRYKTDKETESRERVAQIKATTDKYVAELRSATSKANTSIPKGGTDALLSRMISDLMEKNGLSLTEALEEAQPLIKEIKEIRRESKPDLGALLQGVGRGKTEPKKEEPKDKFTKGKTYTDSNGTKAVYEGNGKWRTIK